MNPRFRKQLAKVILKVANITMWVIIGLLVLCGGLFIWATPRFTIPTALALLFLWGLCRVLDWAYDNSDD